MSTAVFRRHDAHTSKVRATKAAEHAAHVERFEQVQLSFAEPAPRVPTLEELPPRNVREKQARVRALRAQEDRDREACFAAAARQTPQQLIGAAKCIAREPVESWESVEVRMSDSAPLLAVSTVEFEPLTQAQLIQLEQAETAPQPQPTPKRRKR
jgi:hypothetical protein